jgi:hypothetical protein
MIAFMFFPFARGGSLFGRVRPRIPWIGYFPERPSSKDFSLFLARGR